MQSEVIMKGKKFLIVMSLILLVVLSAVALTACDDNKEANYTVNLECKNSSEGSVSGGGSYESGTSVTLEAFVNKGYDFLGWYEGDKLISKKEYYNFTLEKDVLYTAKFAVRPDMAIFDFTSDTERCIIKSIEDKSISEIVIPNCVTDINENAFARLKQLTSVTLPDSLQTIGDNAFISCAKLKSISIPDSVTSIGDYAFYNSGLESVDISGGIRYMGESVFASCNNLADLTIADGVSVIGNSAFNFCNKLTNVTVPNSVRSIGAKAFGSCASLTSLSIPFVGETADMDDNANLLFIFGREIPSSLTNLIITNSVTIPDYALESSRSIKSITLSNKTKYISKGAFYECSSLSEVNIPNSVIYIGENAFAFCRNLTSIILPESVSYIDNNAFQECYALAEVYNLSQLYFGAGYSGYGKVAYYALDVYNSLDIKSKLSVKDGFVIHDHGDIVSLVRYLGTEQEIVVPQGITAIKAGAFACNKNITNVVLPNSVKTIGELAFSECENLVNIDIPDGVQSIEKWAFINCKNLKNLNIPKSTVSIADHAFLGCSSLETINVAEGNPKYRSNGNCLIDTETKSLILGSNKSVIPNDGSITTIANFAFYKLDGLTNIVIPDSVTSIENSAFYGAGLKIVIIPEGVTTIGDSAFSYCMKLTNLTIPKSVISIGKGAFYGCNNLESIIVANGNTNYSGAGNCLIDLVTKTLLIGSKNSVIPDDGSVTVIGAGAFADCEGLTNIVIPNGVMTIESGAFTGCSFLTSVVISDSVKFIVSYAFYNCSSLTSFTFENTEGWYITENKDATDGVAINVTDSEANAKQFKEITTKYWKRK